MRASFPRILVPLLFAMTLPALSSGVGAGSEARALKKRVVPIKPAHTQLTVHVYRDRIVLKLAEGSRLRLRGQRLVSLAGRDLSQLQAVIDGVAGLTVQRLFTRSEEALDREREVG